MRDLELLPVHGELEDRLAEQVFGGEAEAKGIVARIADSPLGLNLRKAFEYAEVEVPVHIDLYKRFDVWLVPLRMSIMRKKGLAEVTSAGCEVEFVDQDRTLCVIELLPTPQFVKHGEVAGSFFCEGRISASGAISPLQGVEENENAAPLALPTEYPKIGLRLGAKGGLALNFRFVVATPFVHAVGLGAKRVEWRLDQHENPLFGRDLEFWAAIVRPKREQYLDLRMRIWLTARTAFFPTRRESEWTEIRCMLVS